jgi:hypothetical protein
MHLIWRNYMQDWIYTHKVIMDWDNLILNYTLEEKLADALGVDNLEKNDFWYQLQVDQGLADPRDVFFITVMAARDSSGNLFNYRSITEEIPNSTLFMLTYSRTQAGHASEYMTGIINNISNNSAKLTNVKIVDCYIKVPRGFKPRGYFVGHEWDDWVKYGSTWRTE